MGNFTWNGREIVQESTVYQTELVFHAIRCKQIYLIRTPCSYCIQSHFLYRQKEQKRVWQQISTILPKIHLNWASPLVKWVFSNLLFESESQSLTPNYKDDPWAEYIQSWRLALIWIPSFFGGDIRSVVMQGEAGPSTCLGCAYQEQTSPTASSCLCQSHEIFMLAHIWGNLSNFHHYFICATQKQ